MNLVNSQFYLAKFANPLKISLNFIFFLVTFYCHCLTILLKLFLISLNQARWKSENIRWMELNWHTNEVCVIFNRWKICACKLCHWYMNVHCTMYKFFYMYGAYLYVFAASNLWSKSNSLRLEFDAAAAALCIKTNVAANSNEKNTCTHTFIRRGQGYMSSMLVKFHVVGRQAFPFSLDTSGCMCVNII